MAFDPTTAMMFQPTASGGFDPSTAALFDSTTVLPASNAPAQQTTDPLGISKYVGEDAWKKTYESIPVLADMVLGIGGMLGGVASDIKERVAGIASGAPRKETAAKAREEAAKTVEMMGAWASPAQSAARALGAQPEASAAGKAVEGLGKWIEEKGGDIEQATNGFILKEDVASIADTIMLALGGRGLGAVKAPKPSGSTWSKLDLKSLSPEELRSGIPKEESIDSIIGKYKNKTGEDITRAEVMDAIQPITRGMKDAELNAEAIAYDLMQQGASLKEVRAVRKKNPLVGKKLDELMARREEAMRGPLGEGVVQGEVLPPELKGEPTLESTTTGTDLVEPARMEPVPVELPAPAGGNILEMHTFNPVRAAKETLDLVKFNPELAKTVGIAGAGALAGYTLAEEGDLLSSLYGAGGALLTRNMLKGDIPSQIDRGLGVLSTQMRNISQVIGDRVALDYELGTLRKAHEHLKGSDPWVRELISLPKEQLNKLTSALFSGLKGGVEGVLREIGNPSLAREYYKVRDILNTVGRDLKDRGLLKNWREDYYPRIVTNREGLLDTLGIQAKETLTKLLAEAERKAVAKGEAFGELEASHVINTYLKSPQGRAGVGFLKGRKIGEVPEELLPFYANPIESLHTYLRSAVKEAAKADLFGKDLKLRDGKIDMESSIGELVSREIREGRLTPDQVPALHQLLRDRFVGGERSGASGIQTVKNVANIGLLADVVSAFRQLSDIGTVFYKYGVKPTMMAVVQGLRGKNSIRAADFGLMDHLAEEFVNQGTTARFLNTAFKASGFSLADLSMKTLDLNASLKKNQSLAKSESGARKLVSRWGDKLGPEGTAKLLQDLRDGNLSDDVLTATFADLTKSQPVSMSELPPAYAANPNGRFLYMLKSWQLKQYDLLRNDVYKQIKEGHVKEGVANLTKYAAAMTASGVAVNTVVDWLLGKPIDFEQSVPEQMLKTIGWSSYQNDKMKSGKPAEALVGMAAPPYAMFDDIISRDPKATRYIPVVGDLLYFHQFGGSEKAWVDRDKRLKREAKAEARALDPERFRAIEERRKARALEKGAQFRAVGVQ